MSDAYTIVQRAAFFRSADIGGAMRQLLADIIERYSAGAIDIATAAAEALPRLADSDTYLSSEDWLRPFLRTVSQQAASEADIASQTPDTIRAYPAWELVRYSSRMPRTDWPDRWDAAGEACDWEGASHDRMAALKASPIWASLGAGTGGYADALGKPYPPFAWGSGLAWRDMTRAEATAAGLACEPITPLPGDDELREYARKYGIARESL